MQSALAGLDDVVLAAVVPAPPDRARRLRDELGLTCAIACDPDWVVHRALGLGRGGVRAVWLSATTWRQCARLVARGRRLRLPQQDPYPLGGVAVLDEAGETVWRYAGRDAGDYAAVAAIVVAVAA